MSFQSLSFLAFLALTAIACTLLRRRSALAGLLPCCAPGAS